jgi:hypothetical protein
MRPGVIYGSVKLLYSVVAPYITYVSRQYCSGIYPLHPTHTVHRPKIRIFFLKDLTIFFSASGQFGGRELGYEVSCLRCSLVLVDSHVVLWYESCCLSQGVKYGGKWQVMCTEGLFLP